MAKHPLMFLFQGDQLSIILVMFLIMIHTMRRLYECLYVSVFSKTAKINIIQYIWGFVYYILIVSTLVTMCIFMLSLNLYQITLCHVHYMISYAYLTIQINGAFNKKFLHCVKLQLKNTIPNSA